MLTRIKANLDVGEKSIREMRRFFFFVSACINSKIRHMTLQKLAYRKLPLNRELCDGTEIRSFLKGCFTGATQ